SSPGQRAFTCERRLDVELEVGAVASRTLRSVTPAEAESAIAGYLGLSDWSARGTPMVEMEGRLGPFKGKDCASCWARAWSPRTSSSR
ncbi:MAG: fumarylacetoacetate hydrolase family protein, partial [Pseudorhodobacter sp.]|nr:fumarylacetoacetate hydrolase family protein [Frankiaceae bacterium]